VPGTALPTIGAADFRELSFGNDVINIGSSPGTVFTVGVFGSGSSSFTLLVSQNASLVLLDGVPQVRAVLVLSAIQLM
jgi:hypothetical protein